MNFIPTGNIDKWFADNGDTTLRIDYPLTKDSLVLDVGGYRGDWSQKIADKYNPYIYIFEPIPQFCYLIMERFKQNPKVLVFNFGLSNTTRPANISVNNDSSSIYLLSDNQIRIILIDIDQFLRNFKSHEINLIKITLPPVFLHEILVKQKRIPIMAETKISAILKENKGIKVFFVIVNNLYIVHYPFLSCCIVNEQLKQHNFKT